MHKINTVLLCIHLGCHTGSPHLTVLCFVATQDVGGAGCGCPPPALTCHKRKCGLKWQHARVHQFSAGFAATRMAASYLIESVNRLRLPVLRAGCQGKSTQRLMRTSSSSMYPLLLECLKVLHQGQINLQDC